MFSKAVLAVTMAVYIITVVFGYFVVANEPSCLGELLTFVGAPTAVAIGFYAWKAKSENVLKIDSSDKTKQKIVNGAFRSESDGNQFYGYNNFYDNGGDNDAMG